MPSFQGIRVPIVTPFINQAIDFVVHENNVAINDCGGNHGLLERLPGPWQHSSGSRAGRRSAPRAGFADQSPFREVEMFYRIAADTVVSFHLLFILFVLFGGLMVLRWRWLIWLLNLAVYLRILRSRRPRTALWSAGSYACDETALSPPAD